MKVTSAEFVKSAFERSHWVEGDLPEISFLGRSNVGKSSLLNSLLDRKKLARISNTPGRTQSINFFLINEALYFVDLPGYGYAKVPKKMRQDWGKMAEEYLAGLNYPVAAIEEPVAVGDFVNLSKLSNKFSLPIIFDESVCTIHDLEQVPLPPAFSIINVRISKMGGLLRTLEMIDRIREKKFSLIIGCLVGETSLLSRVALIAASYCENSLIAQEGAFGDLLLQHDFVEPMLRFGKKGILKFVQEEYPQLNPKTGWGLKMIK